MSDRSLSEAATALAVQNYRESVADLERPEPTPDRGGCLRHPEWARPNHGPRPPAALCPMCREEASPDATPRATRTVSSPSLRPDPTLDRRYERYLETSGQVVSGSHEETEALRLIDEARDEDSAGLMRDFAHPDVSGVTFRRGVSSRVRYQRRAAAARYWKRHV